MAKATKSRKRIGGRPHQDLQAFRDAQARWGLGAVVRLTHRHRAKVCEVGIADPAVTGPLWERPMIVLGSSWSWTRAFADADARAHDQQAHVAGITWAVFVPPAKLELA